MSTTVHSPFTYFMYNTASSCGKNLVGFRRPNLYDVKSVFTATCKIPLNNRPLANAQGVPEKKTAKSFTRDIFGTVCQKVKFLHQNIQQITVYQSMQIMCKWVKYSLLNSWK